jgi:Lipocalin-like domain
MPGAGERLASTNCQNVWRNPMNQRNLLSAAALVVIGALIVPAAGDAQNAQRTPTPTEAQAKPPASSNATEPKSYKDMLVGTWRLLIADEVEPDNTQKPLFGPNPMGTLIFTANGHYSLQIMRYNRPKFATNDRTKGTTDENKSAISQIISHFGTYTVDEASKTLTFRVEGSAYPNWDETNQKRTITSLTASDELTYTVPASDASARPVMVAWRWVQ